MKAIFAHDHRFILSREKVWSESQFEAALWKRYLAHFDTITVAARRGSMPPGKSVQQLELSSAPHVDFELFSNLSRLRGLTLDRPAALRRMQELVARHDAVIARLPSEIGLLAVQSARVLGKPWAVEIAGCPWDGLWNYGSLTGKAYATVAWWRMQRTVARAEHALYVTRSYLQKQYPTQAANTCSASNVMLHDVPVTALTARLERIETLSQRPVRLGLIGTLKGRFKGIQTTLAALADARYDLPRLKLHILGGGDPAPWKSEAERLGLSDLVVFEGTLPAGEAVLRWLDNVDLYLQPSLKEGLPRALIEAMSRGCPCIASTTAGIPELLERIDLIEPGDKLGLANLLRRRLTDREWMEHRAGRNWNEALGYQTTVLDQRRHKFWQCFVDDVRRRELHFSF
ncbi:glycosyl transferase, group 1 [Roseobacter sp. AzwK-3b]|uniref:glycosyltransferase n=1 Tax=Roseobacter sp. AzwK-3b TaxID=351016 RepID=UPI000156A971|nr:glycosyltransferase [Roseobacter sp. AzwK-3b]EDM69914.1 glycosyl transferase, group 1 [Roseobacter sp. AzwK-3b]